MEEDINEKQDEDDVPEEPVFIEVICEPPPSYLKPCLKKQKNVNSKKVSFSAETIDNSQQRVMTEGYLEVLQRIEQDTKKKKNYILGSDNDDDEFEDLDKKIEENEKKMQKNSDNSGKDEENAQIKQEIIISSSNSQAKPETVISINLEPPSEAPQPLQNPITLTTSKSLEKKIEPVSDPTASVMDEFDKVMQDREKENFGKENKTNTNPLPASQKPQPSTVVIPQSQPKESIIIEQEQPPPQLESVSLSSNPEDGEKEIKTVLDQWDQIMELRNSQKYGDDSVTSLPVQEKIMNFKEAVDYFYNLDLKNEKIEVQKTEKFVSQQKAGILFLLFKLTGNFFGLVPKNKRFLCSPDFENEREVIFAATKVTFDPNDTMHKRILFSVYKILTGEKYSVLLIGDHWQLIGFQGANPATDFRGIGLLGLLQIIYLSNHSTGREICRKLFTLSQKPTESGGFPFCIVCFQFTQFCLSLLRRGELNDIINGKYKKSGVFQCINDVFIGMVATFLDEWLGGKKITDYDYVKKKVFFLFFFKSFFPNFLTIF